MLLGHVIARIVLLGTPISSCHGVKPMHTGDGRLPLKLQHKKVTLNRSVSVPAMMKSIECSVNF